MRRIYLMLLLALAGVPHWILASPLSGDKLDIWNSSYTGNNVANYNGTIGAYNTVSGMYSLAIGTSISLPESTSLAVGYGLTISGSGSGNFYFGGNIMVSNNSASIVGGNYLMVNGAYDSAIFGMGHSATSVQYGLVAGVINVVTGQHYVLGTGLIANNDTMVSATVVGRYNKTLATPLPVGAPKQIFVVGNGASNGLVVRSNALEIYTDGSIKMAPQGDISMGEFGN